MSDQDALLAAIVAHPDEDTPRLMFADWLDENGDPGRAEFIRSQIERAYLERDDPRWLSLINREAELLVAGRKTWLRPYLPWTDFSRMTVRRGLVELAGTSAPELAPHVETFRELTALLELRIEGYSSHTVPTEEEPPVVVPPPRRGWFGAALRKVAALVEPAVAPSAKGYLCRINLAGRPPGLKVRASLGSRFHGGAYETLCLDLLDPNAEALDPPLRAGTWTVLAWAPDVPDEWQLVGRLAHKLCLHTRDAPLEFFRLRVAVRPVRSLEELTAWCGCSVAGAGPHWLRFRDGVAVDRAIGFNPPSDWLGGASL